MLPQQEKNKGSAATNEFNWRCERVRNSLGVNYNYGGGVGFDDDAAAGDAWGKSTRRCNERECVEEVVVQHLKGERGPPQHM